MNADNVPIQRSRPHGSHISQVGRQSLKNLEEPPAELFHSPVLNWTSNLTEVEAFGKVPARKDTHSKTTKTGQKHEKERKKRRVKSFKASLDLLEEGLIYIDLVETSSIALMEIKGSIILDSDADYENVKKDNERYQTVVQRHANEPESLANGSNQTFENYKTNTYTDYRIQGHSDAGTECRLHKIEDECKILPVSDQDFANENFSLPQTANSDQGKEDKVKTDTDSDDDVSDESSTTGQQDGVDLTLYRPRDAQSDEMIKLLQQIASEDELPLSEEDKDEFDIHVPLKVVYEAKRRRNKNMGPRMFPNISSSVIAMERIMCKASHLLYLDTDVTISEGVVTSNIPQPEQEYLQTMPPEAEKGQSSSSSSVDISVLDVPGESSSSLAYSEDDHGSDSDF